MLRLIFRFIALMLLAAAFAALVIDGAKSLSDSTLVLTPLGKTLFALFPTRFPLLQPAIERHVSPFLWDPVVVSILLAPTWAVAGLIGALLMRLTRRRRPPIGVEVR